jgi:GTP1/Obg family GTP-binding protein
MKEQKNIYSDIKSAFDLPLIPVFNKSDLKKPDEKSKKISAHTCSAKEGVGVDEVIDAILKLEAS